MITSQQHMEKALEILKSRNIKVVRHFSPYAEGGDYSEGSAYHRFWDEDGRLYSFLFNDKNEVVWSNLQ